MATEPPRTGADQRPPQNRAGRPRSLAGIIPIPVSLLLVVAAAVLLFWALSGEQHRALIWTSLALAVLAVGALAVALLGRRGQGTVSDEDAEIPEVIWPLPIGEPPPHAAPLAADDVPATAGPDQPAGRPADPRDPVDEPGIEVVAGGLEQSAVAGVGPVEVAVVDGRPRFHLPGCAFLAGLPAVSVPMAEALSSGFTPCAVCRPVTARLAAPGHGQPPPDEILPNDQSPPHDPSR
ncbi:MAG: hypothetical protein ACR2F6_14835 [Mycobacteriales bacterium]